MSIGEELDKTFARIEKAKKRSFDVINRNKKIESEIIEIIWKAGEKFLWIAGNPWCLSVRDGRKIQAAGYEMASLKNDWFDITHLSDGKKICWWHYTKNDDGYYHVMYGDEDFKDEVYHDFPEILRKMMVEYAEIAEKEADEIEAKNEVGLRII